MRGVKQKEMFEISDLRREIPYLRSVCLFFPQRGVLLYFHTYVGSGYFLGSKFCISIILGAFRKLNIFGGMKILWIFLGGHHKIRLGSFLKVNVQNGGYFLGY